MQNKIVDLTNHLYAALERLSDEDLTAEELKLEIARADAVSKIASNIVSAAIVTVTAVKLINNGIANPKQLSLIVEENKN